MTATTFKIDHIEDIVKNPDLSFYGLYRVYPKRPPEADPTVPLKSKNQSLTGFKSPYDDFKKQAILGFPN